MKILTTKDTSLEKITLDKTPDFSENVMYINIFNENRPLYVQTPKMFVSISEDKKTIDLIFKNSKNADKIKDFYKIIRSLEKRVCKIISENSKEWFPKKVSYKSIYNNFFNSSINLPDEIGDIFSMSVNIPYENEKVNFEIYNRKNEQVKGLENLKNNVDVVTILLANELIITSSNAYIVWEIAQIKIHENKKKVSGYRIKTDKPKARKMNVVIKDKKTDEKIKINMIDNDSLDGYVSSSE